MLPSEGFAPSWYVAGFRKSSELVLFCRSSPTTSLADYKAGLEFDDPFVRIPTVSCACFNPNWALSFAESGTRSFVARHYRPRLLSLASVGHFVNLARP